MVCYAQYVAYESGHLLRHPLCCSAHWPASRSANEASCQALCEHGASQGKKKEGTVEEKGRGVVAMMEKKGSVLGPRGEGCSCCLSGETQGLNLLVSS